MATVVIMIMIMTIIITMPSVFRSIHEHDSVYTTINFDLSPLKTTLFQCGRLKNFLFHWCEILSFFIAQVLQLSREIVPQETGKRGQDSVLLSDMNWRWRSTNPNTSHHTLNTNYRNLEFQKTKLR